VPKASWRPSKRPSAGGTSIRRPWAWASAARWIGRRGALPPRTR
jgi:hypothetical protein